MSECVLLSASNDLIDAMVDRLRPLQADLSANLVVFPGKRPQHYLRRAIGRQLGRHFFPPQILSIDLFVDHIYYDRLSYRRRTIEAMDAAAILFELQREGPVCGFDAFSHVEDFLPLGLTLFAELEELYIHGVPLPRLREAVTDLPPRYHLLHHLLGAFYERLDEDNGCTRAVKYRTVADHIDLVNLLSYDRILFGGFYAFTNAEVEMLRRMSVHEHFSLIVHNGPGMAEQLKRAGLRPIFGDPIAERPSVHVHRAPDVHAEIFALNDLLARAPALPEDACVVLPAASSLFPVLRTLPLGNQDSFNVSLQYPLVRTPLFGLLSNVFDLLLSRYEGRLYVADYLRYLLHPYIKNIRVGQRSDITRILCHTVEEVLVENTMRTFLTLEEIEGNERILDRAARRIRAVADDFTREDVRTHWTAIHERTLRAFDAVSNVHDFCNRCVSVIEFLADRSTADRHLFFETFWDAILTALHRLAHSGLGNLRCRDFRGYVAVVESYLTAEEVPFPGTPLHGFQILGLLETRNLRFGTVFVLDANDDVLPGHVSHDLLLPPGVRERLGLPTPADRERIERYYFELLLSQAHEVHLFYVEDGQKVRSRFVERILWEREKAGLSTAAVPLQYAIDLRQQVPPDILKTETTMDRLRSLRLSPGVLDMYNRCALQFYYTHVLNLAERQRLKGEIGRLEIGNVIHTVMERFYRPHTGKQLTPASLTVEQMVNAVDSVVVEELGDTMTGRLALIHEQIRHHLSAYLTDFQLPLLDREPVLLVGVEQPLTATLRGYEFVGRIDRVENRSGRIVLIDYKTGSGLDRYKIHFRKLDARDRSTWRFIGSFQLPVYSLMYADVNQVPASSVHAVYHFLGRNQISSSIEESVPDPGSTPAQRALVEDVLFQLLDELFDPSVPFRATERVEEHCPDCPFKFLCGTQWVRSWRET
jgi:hypothetical protein